jgi:thiamine kinase-like enzyme
MDFLENQAITPKQRESKELYIALADLLKKIHKSPQIPGASYTIYDRIDYALNGIKSRPNQNPQTIEINKKAEEMVNSLKNQLKLEANTTIFNDFHPGNVMFEKGKFLTIDPDLLGIGDPYIDISNAIIFWCFDKKAEQTLLDAYFGRKLTREERNKLFAVKKLTQIMNALDLQLYTSEKTEFIYNLNIQESLADLINNGQEAQTDEGKIKYGSALMKAALTSK